MMSQMSSSKYLQAAAITIQTKDQLWISFFWHHGWRISIKIRFNSRPDKSLHPGLKSACKRKKFDNRLTHSLPLKIKQLAFRLLKAKLALKEAKITLK